MNYDWQTDLRWRSRSAAAVRPPALVEEQAWDILLASRDPPHLPKLLKRKRYRTVHFSLDRISIVD